MANITQWQSAGSQAAYPLLESTLDSAAVRPVADMLRRILVDASLILDSGSDSASLIGISRTSESEILVTIELGSGLVLCGAGLPGKVIAVADQYGHSRGSVVLSDDANEILPASNFNVIGDVVKFDTGCLITIPMGVLESLSVSDVPIAGRIRLVEGDGIKLVSEAGNTIRIDAIGSITNTGGTCPPFYTEPLKMLHVNAATGITGGDVAPSSIGAIVCLPGPQATPANELASFQMLRIEPVTCGLKFSLIE